MFQYNPCDLPEIVCDGHPEWKALYDLAWRLAFQNLEYPSQKGWGPQLSCMPGYGTIWQWDSCFMGLFARFNNGSFPPLGNLDNLYRLQREDGYISMAYRFETGQAAFGERINPPLYAWVEWEYYLLTGDATRFERVLPRLVRYFDWLKAHRTRPSGLYWFEDCGSSGMDNSPRSGYAAQDQRGSDVSFIDLACQQALAARHLEKMARHLGQGSLADRFSQEHAQLRSLINRYHWSERMGIYYDVFGRTLPELRHNFLAAKTAAAFWPMLAEVANEEQVARLMEHLLNPQEFWTLHPVPTLAKDDPNYEPLGGYWCGSVWPPTEYMIVKGLEQRNASGLAREIAVKHLAALAAVYQNEGYGSLWECYAPEALRPATKTNAGDLVRTNFVGWTGLGPIAMLIESILGFSLDAPSNTLTWQIRTAGGHGIKNLRFNGRSVSAWCSDDILNRGGGAVTVETSGELKVNISIRGTNKSLSRTLAAGRHELKL